MKTKRNKRNLVLGLSLLLIGFVSLTAMTHHQNKPDSQTTTIAKAHSSNHHLLKCGDGKCGDAKASDKKADTKNKCGDGKCGDGKAKDAKNKCGDGKCGDGKAKDSDKKSKDAKCGTGKCGKA